MANRTSNAADVEQYLSGINYPADKEDLLQRARESGAPAEVIDTLEGLPEGTYRSTADVSRGIEKLA